LSFGPIDYGRLRKKILPDVLAEGTVIADGSEQDILKVESTECFQVEGYIDLSPLEEGDTVIIRYYIKIKSGGEFGKYAEETYTGVQSSPILYIGKKVAKYGIKITLQQTSGEFKSFDYQFFSIGG